jgi:hypothetical protein
LKATILISATTFNAADRLAKKMKISRSELYTRAIEAFVAKDRRRNVRERLDQVYADEPSTIDSTLARVQAASVRGEDW